MARSHGSPPPGTCHTDLSVENKNPMKNLPEHRNFKKPKMQGANRGQKSGKATQLKPQGQTCIAMTQMHLCNVCKANISWPTENLPVY